MPTDGWEENSQLILTKLIELSAQDDKILEHIETLREHVTISKTVTSVLGGLVVIVAPLIYSLFSYYNASLNDAIDHIRKQDMVLKQKISEQAQFAASEDATRKNNWEKHGMIHDNLIVRIGRIEDKIK